MEIPHIEIVDDEWECAECGDGRTIVLQSPTEHYKTQHPEVWNNLSHE